MLAVAFFGFAIPVNADSRTCYMTEQYYEEVFDFSVDSLTQEIELTVPYSGYYVIQTFGFPIQNANLGLENNGATSSIKLFQGDNLITRTLSENGGYGRGRFLHCELAANIEYRLLIVFNQAQTGRLSITYTEGGSNEDVPIPSYNDIGSFGPGTIPFYFYSGNKYYAQIARLIYVPGEDDDPYAPKEFEFSLAGQSYERAFVFDPTSSEYFAGVELNENYSVYMDMIPNVPYYFVVYFPEAVLGDDFLFIDVPYITVELTFEPA